MFVLWLLSFAGFVWWTMEKVRIPQAFAPLAVACCQTLLLWLSAFVGGMAVASWLMTGAGIALGIWLTIRHSRTRVDWISAAFFVVCAVLLWLRYRGALLVAYDDFSHWGMIARHLLQTGALPTAESSLIVFQSYPPAAACWIAGVCRFCGESDGMLLVAQSWLMLMALWPLTALVRDKTRAIKWVAAALPMLVTLSMFQGSASLMVDNLLAALGIGALAIALWAEDDRGELWCAPVLTVLALTKDSGLFFMAAVWGALLLRRLVNKKRKWKPLLLAVGMPIAARLVWLVHIKTAFPSAELSKHAMSVENMRMMGADKSYGDLAALAGQVFREAMRPSSQMVWILALIVLCCVASAVIRSISQKRLRVRSELLVMGSAAAICAAYLVFLWAMYAFTLPLQTASKLVGFERYLSTCVLFLYGALTLWLLRKCEKPQCDRAWICAGMCVLLALPYAGASWRSGVPRLLRENYAVPLRTQMQELYGAQKLPKDQSAMVYVPDAEADLTFAGYMARYVWQRADITVCGAEEIGTAELGDVIYAISADDALTDAIRQSGREIQVVVPTSSAR